MLEEEIVPAGADVTCEAHVKEQNMRQPKKHESKLWFTEAKKQP